MRGGCAVRSSAAGTEGTGGWSLLSFCMFAGWMCFTGPLRSQEAVIPPEGPPAAVMTKTDQDNAEHSVRTAVIRSALLPGLGQWYNGQKLKAVVVFGAETGLIGAAVLQNQRAVQRTTEAERVFYQDDRSRFLWYAGAFWLLQIIDAHVDAKLKPFDISEDLSLQTISLPGLQGMGLVYRF